MTELETSTQQPLAKTLKQWVRLKNQGASDPQTEIISMCPGGTLGCEFLSSGSRRHIILTCPVTVNSLCACEHLLTVKNVSFAAIRMFFRAVIQRLYKFVLNMFQRLIFHF